MTSRTADDPLREYVRILRGFGLTREEMADLHDCPARPDRETLVRALLSHHGANRVTPDLLYDSVHEMLATSPHGIDAAKPYWNGAPPVQLRAAMAPYGCEVTFNEPGGDQTDVCSTADGPVEIRLQERSSGEDRRLLFEYPDHPLGDDNYPALVHAFEAELLAGSPLTFALLAREFGRWRFVLVEEDRLAALRREYGDRVECFGRPLLHEDQPAAYAAPVEGDATDAALEREAAPDSYDAVRATVDDGAAADVAHGDGDRREPSVDELVDAADPAELVADGAYGRGRERPASVGEAGDGDVEAVFENLETVHVGPADDAPGDGDRDASSQGPAEALGSTSGDAGEFDWAATDFSVEPVREVPPGIDGVFERLERTVATEATRSTTDEDDAVTSSEVLDAIDHRNAADDARVEHGFVWVDPDNLEPVPEEVFAAMARAN